MTVVLSAETGDWAQWSVARRSVIGAPVPQSRVHMYADFVEKEDTEALPASLAKPAIDLSWLVNAIGAGRDGCGLEVLSNLIAGLGDLLTNKDYDAVDLILRSIGLNSVSPEVMLAFGRTCFAARQALSEWSSFVRRIRHEFERRGLAADRAVRGLV
jgi:hypothetical protein